jgi:hypothetical protein
MGNPEIATDGAMRCPSYGESPMEWLDVPTAAQKIGLSTEYTYRLCASKRLAHRRVGIRAGKGKIQISEQAIADFLASCEVKAEQPGPNHGKLPRQKPAPRAFTGRPDGKPLRDDY